MTNVEQNEIGQFNGILDYVFFIRHIRLKKRNRFSAARSWIDFRVDRNDENWM